MPIYRVASSVDVGEGEATLVEVEGKPIAVFRHDGEFFALEETCPHKGGPLHEGIVENGAVTCPWHHWMFDLRTGVSPINPLSKVKAYRAWSEGEDLYIEL